jgi:hypothetical protein
MTTTHLGALKGPSGGAPGEQRSRFLQHRWCVAAPADHPQQQQGQHLACELFYLAVFDITEDLLLEALSMVLHVLSHRQLCKAPPVSSTAATICPCCCCCQGFVALHNLMKATKGTLSIDLKRKLFKGGAPGDSLWRVQPGSAAGLPSGRRRPAARPPPPSAAYYGQAPPQAPPGAYAGRGGGYGGGYGGGAAAPRPGVVYDLPSVSFMDTGARIKVMRHLQASPAPHLGRGRSSMHSTGDACMGDACGRRERSGVHPAAACWRLSRWRSPSISLLERKPSCLGQLRHLHAFLDHRSRPPCHPAAAGSHLRERGALRRQAARARPRPRPRLRL